MNKRNLFLYWVGNEYKLITILRKIIHLHSTSGEGYNVILITEKNINKYIKNIPKYFINLCPAHQADFVRVNVICDYGGIWLDSDTIVLDSLDNLFSIIENKNGFFIREDNNILFNGIFGSKKNTPLMIEWKTKMLNKLQKTNGKIKWCDIGNNMLETMYNNNNKLYHEYEIFNGLDNLYPVNWDKCVAEFIIKPYDNYNNIKRVFQPLIILVNSVYKFLEDKTEEEILEGNMPINYFINKSLENKCVDKKILYSNHDNLNLTNKSNKEIFENIYDKKIWSNNNKNTPLSGPGSSLENTKYFSDILNKFIYNNNIKSVLDLGCGDLSWISKTHFFNDKNIKYIGVDVVTNLIESHIINYKNNQFLCKDITQYSNFEPVDIIIIRDVIFHLTNDEIKLIFENIKNKFEFLIITNCKNIINNDNFNKWRFTEKNIHKEPFNISNNYLIKIPENKFNRDVLIYKHNIFYNIL